MKRSLLWNLTRGALLLCLVLAGLAFGVWLRGRQQPHPAPQALVVFLNVGDGDSTLIRTVNGTTILMDAGPAEAAPVVVRALRRFHVKTLDLLVLASSEPRSVGGVPAVLASGVSVRAVWDTAAQQTNPARSAALEAIRRRHIPALRTASAGDHIQIGSATFWSAVWPPSLSPRAHRDNTVYQLDFGATRILLAGAAGLESESYIIAGRGSDLGCNDGTCTDLILQATAGGADGGTTAELLHEAAPSIVVVSCGAQHPPAPGILHRVKASGAALWRTDTQGSIIVQTDGRSAPTVTALTL